MPPCFFSISGGQLPPAQPARDRSASRRRNLCRLVTNRGLWANAHSRLPLSGRLARPPPSPVSMQVFGQRPVSCVEIWVAASRPKALGMARLPGKLARCGCACHPRAALEAATRMRDIFTHIAPLWRSFVPRSTPKLFEPRSLRCTSEGVPPSGRRGCLLKGARACIMHPVPDGRHGPVFRGRGGDETRASVKRMIGPAPAGPGMEFVRT